MQKNTKTMIIVQQAERNYWLSQCNKLTTVSEKDKWKSINKLTNQQVSDAVQSIQILRQGKPVYLFEDSEIRSELEDFHICKVSQSGVAKQNKSHDTSH